MPTPQLAKAVLIPMHGDEPERDTSRYLVVQFNPASLRVTLSNSLRADNRGGAGGGGPAAQFVEKSESTLAVELLFDTSVAHEHGTEVVLGEGGQGQTVSAEARAAAGSDVRQLTKRIAEAFMQPRDADSPRPRAPQRCRFQWGSFAFTGMLASYNETLDFFSPEGVPLRATVSLTFKEDRFQFDIAGLPGSGQSAAPPLPSFAPGGEGVSADQAAASSGRDPKDWRAVALYNGLENPRFTPAAGLSIPAPGVQLTATSGISGLAGVKVEVGLTMKLGG
ncbi:MAG: hypothetical protein AB1634_03230 [Thermodesulfobacteriota bacterium]